MKFKRTISAFVSTAMAFSLLSLVPAKVSAASDASGTGWSFTSVDGKLSFNSSYTGTELTLDIINGLDGDTAGGAFQKTDVVILDTGDSAVTSVGGSTFRDSNNLTTINMPQVTSIGSYAFFNCDMLETVTFPNATNIYERAFFNCNKLKIVTMPEVTNIGVLAFSYCDKLETVNLPKVTNIDERAFLYCDKIETIDLPEATNIGSSAFCFCSILKTVTLPNATSIGQEAFADCIVLQSITFGKLTPPSLGTNIFSGVDQSKIKINIPINADINAWKSTFSAAGYAIVKLAQPVPPVINITTPQSDFICGVTGKPYNVTLTGSEQGFTYSLDIGSLPDGLTLSTSGLISGTPTVAGTFTFTVKATNGVSTTTQTYTITVTTPYVDDWYTTHKRSSLPIGGYITYDDDEENEDIAAGAGVVSEGL